jgi:GNAT superfamily N-acetyltransferase
VELRLVGAQHREHLAAFTCARYREPWTRAIEEMIRDSLADSLDLGGVEAVGAWDLDVLTGLAVWTVQDGGALWRSNVVAVQRGYQRQGIGRLLKTELVRRARAAGAHRITSTVYWANEPMLLLNRRAGADIQADPEEPRNYRLCTIDLRT